MTKTRRQQLGAWGEQQAVLFLEKKQYQIIARNVRIGKGEIDIVSWHTKPHHGNTLCFIEVKTRSYGLGSAERATDWKKQETLQKTAHLYCIKNHIDIDTIPIQFEQVSIYLNRGKKTILIKNQTII